MSYTVLARKYRPQTFSEVYSQQHIVQIFKNAIETNRIGQAYLFTGSRGVGKTSVARILAKSLNCEVAQSISPCGECANCRDIRDGVSTDVVEIDGASNTGVDDVRELQKELLYATSRCRYKIIIIDEVHMLSKNAFNALLKTLEEPPPNVIFIFATTEPHKVLPTIISRCQRFDFLRIPIDTLVARLKEISEIEKIAVEVEALYLIAKKADGSMRDALSIMDQVIAYGLATITYDEVKQIFGMVGYDSFHGFMQAILAKDSAQMLTVFQNISTQCNDIQEIINNFLEYLRQCIYIKLNNIPLDISKSTLETIQQLVKDFSEDELLYIMNSLIQTKDNLRTSSAPEVLAELTFLKMAQIADMKSLKTVLENVKNAPAPSNTNDRRNPPYAPANTSRPPQTSSNNTREYSSPPPPPPSATPPRAETAPTYSQPQQAGYTPSEQISNFMQQTGSKIEKIIKL